MPNRMNRAQHHRYWLSGLLALITSLCTARGAHAMAPHVDCGAPFVFDDADVNVVVLPYRSAGESQLPLREIGQRLALLVKLDVFSHILDYGSIGAVQMEVRPDAPTSTACEPEVVIRQLLGQQGGAVRQIGKGHGVVFVWGILYEKANDVVVQTYARVLRRDVPETLELKAGDFAFQAKPSPATVVFSPQLFHKDTLEAVQKSFTKADVVRKEPRDDAPGDPLPPTIVKCFGCNGVAPNGFLVDEKKGEWIHVRWLDPRLQERHEGWVHAAGSLSGQSLNRDLPELSYIEGAVGYLEQRVAAAHGQHLSRVLAERTEQSFESFNRAQAKEAHRAAAVGEQLSGIVQLLQHDSESLAIARKHFTAAVKLAPQEPDGITLDAIAEIVSEWGQRRSISSAQSLAARLTAAATLSDDPAVAVGNLRNFYKLLQMDITAGEPRELSPEVVAERLREVEQIRVGAP